MKNAIKQLYICRIVMGLIICILFYMSMVNSVFAQEKSGSCGTFLEWTLSGNSLTISGSGDMKDFSDNELAPWYKYAEEIKTVSLPAGLNSIGNFAFYGCNHLTSITIPDKVNDIGEYAFAQCTELFQVNFGNGVQKLREGAFQCCESLMTVQFPESLTDIGTKAFYRCYSLQAVTIPETVKNMGSSTFAYCTGLVRATMNASMPQVPGWTFYGCSSLTDVSLAADITSVGEYAFDSCVSLNGIYTQQGDIDTAYQLNQSILKGDTSQEGGLVGTYDMPESSVVAVDDGKALTQTKVIQDDEVVISVKNITDYSKESEEKSTIISASIREYSDWKKVAKEVEATISRGHSENITIEIMLDGTVVESDALEQFAGKQVVLNITVSNGSIWKIDMSKLSEESFSGNYDFDVEIIQEDSEEAKIASEIVRLIRFADNINFNATLGIREGQAYDLASLYQKNGREFQKIDTVIVDYQGIAWFSIANIDRRTDYCLGINVEGVAVEEAVIPTTMFEQYDLNEEDEDTYLMDKDGTKYRITGRTSRWGITGKQFAIYVGVAIGATVLIVGSVMLAFNIIKKSREKYERMAEEENLREKEEEEALRMEIMKELLGESDNPINK